MERRMDVYGELLAQIGVSKDENGSKYAVKRLAELMKEGQARQLYDACPTQTELLKLWDLGVTKNGTPHYVENFCRIFIFLLEIDGNGVGTRLLHPKRIRIIHSLLSSGNRTKISSGLLLLKHIALGGSGNVARIMKHVDFSLKAFTVVGVPPKVTGGTLMNAAIAGSDGEYAQTLWMSGDLAKMPTRAAYIEFFKAMVEQCTSMKLAELLTIKNFLGNALHYLSKDPYHVQEDVLKVVQKYILDQDGYVLTPPTKGMILSDKFLSQLAQTIQQAAGRLEGNVEEKVENVLSLASHILIRIVSDPNVGVVSAQGSFMSMSLEHGTKAIGLLCSLMPTGCKEHFRVMHAVFSKNAFVAGLYLKKVSLDLDPKKTTSCLINMSLVIMAFEALLSQIQSGEAEGTLDLDVIFKNWKYISPGEGVSKTGLSKCLQHPVRLISYTTVMYLTRVLQTLSAILETVQRDDKAYIGFRDRITSYSRKRLPDVQIVIACHAKIDSSSPSSERVQHLSGILQLLRLWITLFPEVLLESNIHIESILPSTIMQMHIANQREYADIVRQATTTPRSMTLNPVVGTIAKITLQEPESSNIYQTNLKWLVKQMDGTGVLYDAPVSGMVWVSRALQQKSEFIIEFLVDTMRATMKRPNVYLDVIHSCDFSKVGITHEINPLLPCALEKMCRIIKSKTRDVSDKVRVADFLQRVLIDYCSQSMHPLHLMILFKTIMDIEFCSEIIREEKESKRKRHDILENQLVQLGNLQDISPFNWMLEFQNKAAELVDPAENGRATKKKKKQPHVSDEHSRQTSVLHSIIYDERITRLQHARVQFWTMECGMHADGMLNLFQDSPESTICVMQNQFLFGQIDTIVSKMETFISSLELYASESITNAQAVFNSLSGPSSSIFWERIRTRLNEHMDLVVALYRIIKVFQNLSIAGKDALFERIRYNRVEDRARDLEDLMHSNVGVIVAQAMCQSSSDIYLIEMHELELLVQSSLCSKGHKSSIGQVNIADPICEIVMLNVACMEYEKGLRLLRFVEGLISDATQKQTPIEMYSHCIKAYSSLYTKLQGRSNDLPRVPKTLVDTMFSNVSHSSIPGYLAALVKFIEIEYVVSALVSTLEKAKGEKSKYSRRLLLASLAPILDGCLSEDMPSNLSDILRKAFLKPLLQYYTSKRIECVTEPEDVEIFEQMPRYTLTILPLLINKDSIESAIEATSLVLKSIKSEKLDTISNEYHNPTALQKVHLLQEISRCITRLMCEENHRTEHSCVYICNLSVSAMNIFSSTLGKRKHRTRFFEAIMDLLDILGDAVAEFNQEDRGREAFIHLLRAWASTFVPCILKTCRINLASSRCLRRFTASLIPEDADGKIVQASSKHCTSVYETVCSLFLGLITADEGLDTIKENEFLIGAQSEYQKNKLPLDSIVACVGSGTMTWNGLSKEQDTKSMQKTEICELLESLVDIVTHFESLVSSEAIQRHQESFEIAEPGLLRYLLASYNASLIGSDIATWSLIKTLNKRIWRRHTDTCDRTTPMDSERDSIDALLGGPISKMKFAWGARALNPGIAQGIQIIPLRCAMTVVDFPEWRSLISEDRLPDNTIQSEIPAEYFMSYEPLGYDPAFLVPVCLSLLKSGDMAGEDLVDSLALSVIIRCLGSGDILLRAIAMECLSWLDENTPSLFDGTSHDFQRLRLLLDWLKNSATASFQRFSSLHAVFAAELSVAIFRPASDLFPLFSKYMSGSAFLDFKRIPLLKSGMLSSDESRKIWFLKLLVCGIRNKDDVFLYSKSHIFELGMGWASSGHNKHQAFATMLVEKAASIPKSARMMAESCGLMSWLALAILALQDTRVDSTTLSRLKNAWTVMSSWKGTLQRGSERDRVHAGMEFRAAEARLGRDTMI